MTNGPEGDHSIPQPTPHLDNMRRRQEQYGATHFQYPIAEKGIVENVRKATVEELEVAVFNALAYKEGLELGPDLYDLDDPEVLAYLYNKMLTVEGTLDQPSSYYLDAAITEKIVGLTVEIKDQARKEKRLLTHQEKEKISKLTAVENHRQAREVVFTAFMQRMLTSGDAGEAADLAIGKAPYYSRKPPVAPDRKHWRAFFQGKRGETINKVLCTMVDAGTPSSQLVKNDREPVKNVPSNIYALGFVSQEVNGRHLTGTEIFKNWLNHMLETANGRMDIVWNAWQVFLMWEISSTLGFTIRINPDKRGQANYRQIIIGDPPLVSDLGTWILHTNARRALEWGVDADGKRTRNSRYLTHSGYPLSIDLKNIKEGSSGGVGLDYLRNSKVKRKGEDASLWEIWREERISLADNRFPWEATEVQPDEDIDEVPPASYGGWLIQRRRWKLISDYLRSRPTLQELVDPAFYEEKIRNWDKGAPIPEDAEPGYHLRARWLRSVLYPHREGGPVQKGDSYEYVYAGRRQWITKAIPAAIESMKGASAVEAVKNAILCGLIRPKDEKWMYNNI